MRTPLNLAGSVLVTRQLNLAHATNGLARRRDRACHATVPDLDYLIHACARDHKRTVFIPIYGKELCARGGDGEDSG